MSDYSETSPTQSVMQKAVPKLKIFGTLLTDVIRKNRCSGCGACVAVCPPSIVLMKKVPGKDEEPTLSGKCILCEFCYYQCPWTEPLPTELDVFGRNRNETEEFGVHLDYHSARSKREDFLKVASDGGVVTSLLAYALEKGVVDCGVVSGVSEKESWKPIPKVVSTVDELIKNAGTRYSVSPTIMGLGSAVEEYGKRRIAVVGTPCQVRAVRKMQTTSYGATKFGLRVGLTMGLFCMENFYYDGLIKTYLQQKIDLNKISKFSIKKGRFIVEAEGQMVVDVPLAEVGPYVRTCCHSCDDFTAELADISVGGQGSPLGWSTVIIRTETGKKIFEDAMNNGFIEFNPTQKPNLAWVVKLSKLKKEKAKQEKQSSL